MNKNIWLARDILTNGCTNKNLLTGVFGNKRLPVIFSEENYKNVKSFYGFIRMPHDRYGQPQLRLAVSSKSLTEVKDFSHIIVKSKDEMSWWELFNSINHCDSKTFVFKDVQCFLSTLHNIQTLISKYKFNTNLDFINNYNTLNSYINYGDDKSLAFSVTIHNIDTFCPIYNTSAVDGIGIAIEIIDIAKSNHSKKLYFIQNSYHIVSNYKDNIFYLDGMRLQNYNLNQRFDQYIENYESALRKSNNRSKKKESRGIVFEAPDHEVGTIGALNTFSTTYYTDTTLSDTVKWASSINDAHTEELEVAVEEDYATDEAIKMRKANAYKAMYGGNVEVRPIRGKKPSGPVPVRKVDPDVVEWKSAKPEHKHYRSLAKKIAVSNDMKKMLINTNFSEMEAKVLNAAGYMKDNGVGVDLKFKKHKPRR